MVKEYGTDDCGAKVEFLLIRNTDMHWERKVLVAGMSDSLERSFSPCVRKQRDYGVEAKESPMYSELWPSVCAMLMLIMSPAKRTPVALAEVAAPYFGTSSTPPRVGSDVRRSAVTLALAG